MEIVGPRRRAVVHIMPQRRFGCRALSHMAGWFFYSWDQGPSWLAAVVSRWATTARRSETLSGFASFERFTSKRRSHSVQAIFFKHSNFLIKLAYSVPWEAGRNEDCCFTKL